MNVYLDMDDVVADWMAYAKQIIGRDWEPGERIPSYEWQKVKDNERFYRNLPLKDGAYSLVDWCRRHVVKNGHGLYFLTALPHDDSVPYAAYDKVLWAQEYFPGIPVFIGPYSHDKWKHCKQPNDVLIDDRSSNCE